MFTLQILDRGQTFLHPLDQRSLLLGSRERADIRLGEEGVAGDHARIDLGPNGPRLTALAPTTVNGRAVQTVDLALGDRIELGRCVIVVGRTVARAARPEDVLATPSIGRAARRPVRQRRLPVLPIAGAALLALGVGWLALQGGDGGDVRAQLADVAALRQKGQLEQAMARIEQLRAKWAAATDDRLQRLDEQVHAVRAVETTFERLRTAVLDPTDPRSYGEWSLELQRLEQGGDPAERVAARQLRGSLRATLELRPKPVVAPGALASTPAENPAAPEPQSGTAGQAAPQPLASKLPAPPPAASGPNASVSPTAPEQVMPAGPVDYAAVDRLCAQGLFAPAIELLQANLADAAGDTAVSGLRERIAAVRAQALDASRRLLADVEARFAAGETQQAQALLQAASNRFPGGPEFAPLGAAMAEAERRLAAAAAPRHLPPAVDAAVRTATLATLRSQMDGVRAAEEQGAFAQAVTLLRAAAESVQDRDPDFAARLQVRAAEAELLASWHEAIATAVAAGKTLTTVGPSGAKVTVRAVEGSELVGSSVGGEVRLRWPELSAEGVLALAEQAKAAGRAALGAAAMLYQRGESSLAESLLARTVQADATLQPAVDRVIARGRGEPFDPRGYRLAKEGFVSARSIEVQKSAQALTARLETALRDKNRAVREALVTEVLAAGPDSVAVLSAAMRRELDKQIGKLQASSLKKQVDRLAAQREQLDAVRKNARDLIYDETRYFYPYKPPAVSSDRYAEYVRVQAEVDRRVAALRTVWADDRARVRVPESLRADLDRLDYTAKVLAQVGELDAAALQDIEWARAVPPGDSIGVRDYCRTPAERSELEEWRRVEAYNAAIGPTLSSAQREQLKVTNEYRAMFRHRPLAVVKSLCEASQGHAVEMAKLGYFAHMSPTPERRTPYDRMRLAGYTFGVSENIALVDGAQGAHNAWCTSSGHHRNLLSPSHREMGIGADGRYWVQNFGSGTVHRDDPAWAATAR
jgi:hypothetical protein